MASSSGGKGEDEDEDVWRSLVTSTSVVDGDDDGDSFVGDVGDGGSWIRSDRGTDPL